jgi:GDP-4-dehydro-6-deoxy-D-mannose reductase
LRVLITGASGFAGRWLAQACREFGDEVIGISRGGGSGRGDGGGSAPGDGGGSGRGDGGGRDVALDLRDAEATARLVAEIQPEVVYHLAALSHVGRSWEEPAVTLGENVTVAVNLLEAIRRHAPGTRIVWASSCEVYGSGAQLPVTEAAPLAPANPYAVSKAAGEMLAGVYADAHGLRVVRARPFNHAGPGQLPIFIVSSLARQAAEARRDGVDRVRIVSGNPDTRRDFTDVRDVVRAYRLLAEDGVAPGIYNIGSSRSVSAAEQIAMLSELLAPIEVEHVVDPARVRAHEVLDHRGSFDRLHAATGWAPRIPLRQTIADTVAWWEAELGSGG